MIYEKITFLHFYQTSMNEHKDKSKQSSDTQVRKIQSTLRITDDTVSKEFAKIFDRLHHRDKTSVSRRLMQIGGNPEDLEKNFEGMVLKLESQSNPQKKSSSSFLLRLTLNRFHPKPWPNCWHSSADRKSALRKRNS